MSAEFPQDYPAYETDGVRQAVGRIRSMQTQIRESTSNLLRTAGIFLTREGMRIASSLVVEGDLTATGATALNGATAVGGTLNVTGDAVFSGNLAVPNGSIDNDALANPVEGAVGAGVGSAFAVTTAGSIVASATIAVPPGFSRALVTATAGASAVCPIGSPSQAYVAATIDGVAGQELWTLTTDAVFVATVTATHSRTLTGLSGGTISIGARFRSTTAWPSHPANAATVSATAFFFR